jgi:murein DD-endopeptidase MepM/ murein hydrolase activator NlpD
MKKKHWFILATITTIFLMSTKKAFSKITDNQNVRGCDPFGCGSFGASRGSRKHNGIDVVTVPNQLIKSPINGEITRFPFPYGTDLSYTGIEIINSEYKIKIFYVTPLVAIGKKVSAGEVIAKSQNISAKYSNEMVNHVHLEVYKNGVLIDPTKLF